MLFWRSKEKLKNLGLEKLMATSSATTTTFVNDDKSQVL